MPLDSASLDSPAAEAWIGRPLHQLDTPALLLDAAACQRNLERMASFFRDRACRLRPHFKNHKCVELARRQMQAGNAVGMTCAKLGEAEVLAEAGFDDLLVANQVVGEAKLERLVKVARGAKLAVAIDHADHVTMLSQAASAAGVEVGVLIEVDGGMGRCGLPSGEPVLKLAEQVRAAPGLRFDGLQCFEGHCVYFDDREQRFAAARDSMQQALDTRQLLERRGISVGVLSGGSSSTYQAVGTLDGVDEIQAGTYATMDWRYQQLVPEFEVALSVLVRIISCQGGKRVVDLGIKGAGCEFGLPRIKGHPEVEIPFFKAEEHCILRGGPDWKIGDTVEFLPSHACSTCNLHRAMYVHQKGVVVDVWPIEGAGRLQ